MSPPPFQIKLRLSRTQVRARLALRQPANSRKSLETQAARLALRRSRQIRVCCIPLKLVYTPVDDDVTALICSQSQSVTSDDDRCSCARRPKQAKPRRQDVCVRLEAARGHLTGNFGTQHIHIHTERSESCRAARTPANARPQPPLFCRECSRCSIGALLLDRNKNHQPTSSTGGGRVLAVVRSSLHRRLLRDDDPDKVEETRKSLRRRTTTIKPRWRTKMRPPPRNGSRRGSTRVWVLTMVRRASCLAGFPGGGR